MTETTPDYAGLSRHLGALAHHILQTGAADSQDAQTCLEVAEALRALLQERDEAQREAKKQKERLFKQIYFTDELQHLLWALAEGNPLPDTIKGGHAYTVASRAKARAEAAEAQLAEAMKALAEVRRRARNIWGACSSDQIIDKDVERQAKLMLEYIDAALEKGNSDGE